MTQTNAIVLNIDAERAAEFEELFAEHELGVWRELFENGVLLRASLTPLAISTQETPGCKQYLVVAEFEDMDGHHEHDSHPAFKAYNELADAFQPAEPFVFGGMNLHRIGDE
ncbi:MAG TPA: hypothetical protein VGB83_10210 [Actinomycetota bacterium]